MNEGMVSRPKNIPRALGRGEATPRRESPGEAPYAVAMERACRAAAFAVAAWVCDCGR